MKKLFILLFALMIAVPAFAQQRRTTRRPQPEVQVDRSKHNVVKEDGKTVIYEKKTVVDFDDSLIEGEVKNPNEFYFVHRNEEKFDKLVKRRPNFHKEMLRDSVMIR